MIAKHIGTALFAQNATISTAESCTGGAIAHSITAIAGSSAYFKGALVAYANEIKQDILNVPSHIIETHGAVSRECVE
ncbi:MAG: CinA family protein, partial [Bacteroidales bacterium]|nr:CinA family protein [Bacteroidales bacterium]